MPGFFAAALSGCHLSVAFGIDARTDHLSPDVPDQVTCETGSFPMTLSGWRAAVAQSVAHAPAQTSVESARLECKSVIVGYRPVVIGSTSPSVMMLQLTESQLRVELFLRADLGCTSQRWVGRSSWRSIPNEPETPDGQTALIRAAQAALKEAFMSASMWLEDPTRCPPL
jgi:hypothetical protein